MTFSDLIGWLMKFFVGEKSGRAAQRAEDVAAEKEFVVDAMETKARVDDAVRDTDAAHRRELLRRWTAPGSSDDKR